MIMDHQNETTEVYQWYLFKQIIAKDPVMVKYMEDNETVKPEMIEKLHNFYNMLKNKRLVVEIGKSVVRGVLINTKKVVLNHSTTEEEKTSIISKIMKSVKPIFNFIEPENIEARLTDDENLALITDMIKNKKEGKEMSLYMLIGTNMLMSLVSSNISNLIGENTSNLFGTISKNVEDEEYVSNLYNKLSKSDDQEDPMSSPVIPGTLNLHTNENVFTSISKINNDVFENTENIVGSGGGKDIMNFIEEIIIKDEPVEVEGGGGSMEKEELEKEVVVLENEEKEYEEDMLVDNVDSVMISDMNNKRSLEIETNEMFQLPKRTKSDDGSSKFDLDAIFQNTTTTSSSVDDNNDDDEMEDMGDGDGDGGNSLELSDIPVDTNITKDLEIETSKKTTTKIKQMLDEFKKNSEKRQKSKVLAFE